MSADELTRRALAAHRQGNIDEADSLYSEALKLAPDTFDALHMLGTVRIQQGRIDEAIALLSAALELSPDNVHLLADAGFAFEATKRWRDAAKCYSKVVKIRAPDADTLVHLGIAQVNLHDARRAVDTLGSAIQCRPDDAVAYFNRAAARRALDEHEEALPDLDRAIALQPNSAIAHCLHGRSAAILGHVELAANSFARAIALDRGLVDLLGDFIHSKDFLCDWDHASEDMQELIARANAGQRACSPFVTLTVLDDPALQLRCASLRGADLAVEHPLPKPRLGQRTHERTRVAYLSANYYEHAVAYLIAELFERHDRARFEIVGVSFGPDGVGVVKSRVATAVDRFVDVRERSDCEVATLLKELDVDLAVDLMGHTGRARPGILAYRPAPVQVNFLGYPGTMGAGFIDYIIADPFIVPAGSEQYYSEQVVRLPECYQPNDTKRRVAERTPSRVELGLPERGFVFCSFNNSYKINPPVYEVWMRLLRQVDGSVLWLLETSAATKANLRREAERRGVAGERVVFAPRMELAEHLARHRAADLFLDTLPYNAHTTASDALWAGLPVVTCAGRSFAARVAGSLLHAVGLPELVTTSLVEYEGLVLALVRDPVRLGALRERLARNRATVPLFDIERYRRHLESAYETMWEIYCRGQPPRSFDVAPINM